MRTPATPNTNSIGVAAAMLAVLVCLCRPNDVPAAEHTATGKRAMVATVHPLATDAAISAFRSGGNAIDAAVAAALTLGVVDGHNSGIGGGCFILLRLANGQLVALDGREMAPQKATRDMFLRDGKPIPRASQIGPLAVGIPGALLAYDQAVRRYGRLPLRRLLLPAAKVAEQGFAIDRVYARNLSQSAQFLRRFEASRNMLLNSHGKPWPVGARLKLPDLAKSYRAIARHGVKWFYTGDFATRASRWMRENGGIIERRDFARYQVKVRRPIRSTYRGLAIAGFAPPSSGGIHVAQILNILEHFELRKLYRKHPHLFHHVFVEALKRAFADRAHWLGDADYAKVPRGLISKSYAATLARQISLRKSTVVARYGTPPKSQQDFFGRHTTHISVADKDGNWVAITATVNTSFGSKVVIPGTGIVLNNEMDDFSIQPGVPNAFGLIGGTANQIAPGKRPLSSMSPTIVMQQNKPIFTVGAAGGPRIITAAALAIVRVVDLQMSLADAIAKPRIHHHWAPDRLYVERGFPPAQVTQLRKMGHKIVPRKRMAVSQAIGLNADGSFLGVHDPRVPGKAAGLP